MVTRAVPLLLAAAGVLFAVMPSASADDLASDTATLALPDEPAGDDALRKESGSSPTATVVDANDVMQPASALPSTTVQIPDSSGLSTVNFSNSTVATSNLSATITNNGIQ
jgi:hypothetical protein